MKPIAIAALAVAITFNQDYSMTSSSEPPSPQTATSEKYNKQARRILKEVPLIDGHNDLPWQFRGRENNHFLNIDLTKSTAGFERPMHTDIPRLIEGGLGGQFWSVYVPASLTTAEAVKAVIEQMEVVHRLVETYPKHFELAATADDVVRIHKRGKIASMMGIEGGHSINNSLAVLRQFYRSGARYMTITHGTNIDWADSATDEPVHNGLTAFGKEVIREMNRMGMLIDLSHVSPKTMHDILDITEAPIIFSHSSAYGLVPHPRNVPDDILARVKKNKGIVMITFVTGFVNDDARNHWANSNAESERLKSLYPNDKAMVESEMEKWKTANPTPQATLSDVVDHMDYIRKTIGSEYIGIGSDFDGASMPVGLEDVSKYPALLAELLRRGYSEKEVKNIAGLNVLRVMRGAEKVAAKLQKKRQPSDARIEELDGNEE